MLLASGRGAEKLTVYGFRTYDQVTVGSAIYYIEVEPITLHIKMPGQLFFYLYITHMCGQSYLTLGKIIRMSFKPNVNHGSPPFMEASISGDTGLGLFKEE